MATMKIEYGKPKKDGSRAVYIIISSGATKKRVNTKIKVDKNEMKENASGMKITNKYKSMLVQEKLSEFQVNYQQTKDLLALDVEKSSCIGHDNNSHLSWVFTYPHVAMLRAALTSASATLPQCTQRKCLPCLMPI